MEILNFIQENNIIVILALLIIGKILKDIDNKYINNKYIPLVLLPVGIGLVVWNQGSVDAQTFLQGILCAGCAVYGNQIYKQLSKVEENKEV